MPAQLVTVPCLDDNYAFLVHDEESGATAVIDAPEAAPLEAALKEHGWQATDILITHHHGDHIAGVPRLREASGARVIGAASDAARLPPLDLAVRPGEHFQIGSLDVEVLEASGHTVGHIAFYMPGAGAVFTGDCLMALGCGRLFEGTPEQMWASLSRIAALPADTLVCSGHEYTRANARFALTVDPDNSDLRDRAARVDAARAAGRATVPSRLGEEQATNPFLRAADASVKQAIGMPGASDVAAFAEVRARKDRF